MSKNFELLRQIGREHDLFQTSAGSRVAKTADCERASLVEIALPRPEPKEARQQIRSPELVKEKAKSWNQEISRKEFPREISWFQLLAFSLTNSGDRICCLASLGSGLGSAISTKEARSQSAVLATREPADV